MALALLACIALVILLPLLIVGLLLKRSNARSLMASTNDTRPDAPPLGPVAPQWAPDPTRRHDYRYWNGARWTEEVSDRGVLSKDAVTDY
jgi:hypothetical protein